MTSDTLRELAHALRGLGRYDMACKPLEDVLREIPVNQQSVELTGELVVIYRHLNRLEDAKHACEDQYRNAKRLHLEQEMCRAIGNLGMINYQLFLSAQETPLLDLAIIQLEEGVERARRLGETTVRELSDPVAKAWLQKFTIQQQAIGLSRLSLCFTEKAERAQAIRVALEALQITFTQQDPTKIALSRFFYGRALLLGGCTREALGQFNPVNTCTPAIALCKEPSDEYRGYLRESIEAGADMEIRDEQGYSALDCAIYSGDAAMQGVVEEGLRLKFAREAKGNLDQLRYEGLLRKGYRELFQDKLRPFLLRARGDDSFAQLRHVYADALATENEKGCMFDGLKFIRYTDFLRYGKLPRSSDGITEQIGSGSLKNGVSDFIIFFSYRWIAKDPGSLLKVVRSKAVFF